MATPLSEEQIETSKSKIVEALLRHLGIDLEALNSEEFRAELPRILDFLGQLVGELQKQRSSIEAEKQKLVEVTKTVAMQVEQVKHIAHSFEQRAETIRQVQKSIPNPGICRDERLPDYSTSSEGAEVDFSDVFPNELA